MGSPSWAVLWVWLPLVVPGGVALAAAGGRRAPWTRWAERAVSLVVLAAGLALVLVIHTGGPLVTGAGLLRADALSAYLLLVVGAVAATATWGGAEAGGARPDGFMAALVCLFLAAMSLALLADNLGVVWVAVEATTIATAFLVGSRGGRHPLEAAWKYVVLGSVGVAIALLGIVLLYAATVVAGEPTLSWVALASPPPGLDPALTRAGIALAALGFATKAGLAPMHSWLPDAHSQAPARVSALMSGVLLAVAFSVLLRLQVVSDAILGPGLMRGLLVTGGLGSLAVAAALIWRQRDYKRLLAYSSIEHMGVLALGAAVGGPVALAAVLLHILGHGLAKASLFVVAGRMLAAEGTSAVDDVRGLLRRRPDLAVPLLAGTGALLAFPPSVLFFTEVAIVITGWQAGLGWGMAAALALLLLAVAGTGRHVLAMTVGGARVEGPPGAGTPSARQQPPRGVVGLPVTLALVTTAVVGFAAWPMASVLREGVAVLAGGP